MAYAFFGHFVHGCYHVQPSLLTSCNWDTKLHILSHVGCNFSCMLSLKLQFKSPWNIGWLITPNMNLSMWLLIHILIMVFVLWMQPRDAWVTQWWMTVDLLIYHQETWVQQLWTINLCVVMFRLPHMHDWMGFFRPYNQSIVLKVNIIFQQNKNMLHTICNAHKVMPLIARTSLSHRRVDSAVWLCNAGFMQEIADF